jgi:hypothetical protein
MLGRTGASGPRSKLFAVRSARFRTTSRVFAVLLLAWTTADLCGHGMCVHDREPLVPSALATPGRLDALAAPPGGHADAAACNGPDDCFCCCRCVEVQIPFRIQVQSTFVSCVLAGHRSLPSLAPPPLYHPPLA